MKSSDSVLYAVKQWRRLAMPPSDWGVDITQLLHVCGRTLDLRAVMSEQGHQVLEVFCTSDDEQARAEALVHQAAADELLRSDINSQCSKEIGTLVDSVLKRATGR
jgi:hypothetical protein